MDSSVEVRTVEAHELPGGASLCSKRGKATQFASRSYLGCHEVTGLNTYRGSKRKEQLGVLLTGLLCARSGQSGILFGSTRLLSRYK